MPWELSQNGEGGCFMALRTFGIILTVAAALSASSLMPGGSNTAGADTPQGAGDLLLQQLRSTGTGGRRSGRNVSLATAYAARGWPHVHDLPASVPAGVALPAPPGLSSLQSRGRDDDDSCRLVACADPCLPHDTPRRPAGPIARGRLLRTVYRTLFAYYPGKKESRSGFPA